RFKATTAGIAWRTSPIADRRTTSTRRGPRDAGEGGEGREAAVIDGSAAGAGTGISSPWQGPAKSRSRQAPDGGRMRVGTASTPPRAGTISAGSLASPGGGERDSIFRLPEFCVRIRRKGWVIPVLGALAAIGAPSATADDGVPLDKFFKGAVIGLD